MRDVAILGRDHIKVDSLDKVLGRAKFAADYYMPDMLYGGVFRSTVPHAYIKKLNLEKARALPGVAAVLDYTAIPGKNRFGIIVKDEPCLVDDKVRRYGDAIAVVAAETPEIVQEAMQLIEVEYEELPVINSYESAMAEGAICVHGTTNVHAKKHMEFGNVDEAWSKCDVIVENTYSTHVLSHMFIEPDAGIAYYDEKGIMTVIASTQNPHYDRNEVAGMLGVPQNHVRCIQPTTGGGFGGKLDIGVQLHCALLAHYTKRPVKIVRSRVESTMMEQLGLDASALDLSKNTYGAQETYTVHKGEALFPRIDVAKEIAHLKEEDEKRKAAAEAANKAKAEAEKKAAAPAEESTVDFTHEEEIDFDTFCKVELRVAEVRACENLKESKKLLHLTVFDGERERCILSGIAKWFKPEDLIGKKIGIVCNLAPRPMMKGKYVSEGMIFAADTADGGCSIAFYGDDTPVGSRIH